MVIPSSSEWDIISLATVVDAAGWPKGPMVGIEVELAGAPKGLVVTFDVPKGPIAGAAVDMVELEVKFPKEPAVADGEFIATEAFPKGPSPLVALPVEPNPPVGLLGFVGAMVLDVPKDIPVDDDG